MRGHARPIPEEPRDRAWESQTRAERGQFDFTAHREPSFRAILKVAPSETAHLKASLRLGASVAVSLLCTEVSSRPAVSAVGKGAGCDWGGCPASKGPCCLSPFPSQDLAPGLSLAGSRKQVGSQSCSRQRAQMGHVISSPWKPSRDGVAAAAPQRRRGTAPQPLAPHRLQAARPGRVPARRLRWGLCQALFLTRSSHSRWSEGPLGSPFIRALISFMRAPDRKSVV